MFKKNSLLLGFAVIIVIGMLTYFLAWRVINSTAGDPGHKNPTIRQEEPFPQNKMILKIEEPNNLDEEDFKNLLFNLPGIKRVFFFSDKDALVVFYDPSIICEGGIMSSLHEEKVKTRHLKY